ncbi:MAG TPA: spermidine synthase [Mycobacteriales bacterium]|jgi:spermidine synthase|nr:spermidine synthase [Mycobacteriales bacterium]
MARLTELDWRQTPLGEISLRRRLDPVLQVDVYEVKLGDEFLMSSLFTVAEVELARLGLAAVHGAGLDVVVGGLGLGYTARAALTDPRVRSLHVVEALDAVIGWQRDEVLPYAAELTGDPRTCLVHGDFFALVAAPPAPGLPARWHAALVDIDHTPSHLLHPGSAGFYSPAGLRRLAARLHPGGVFALWSDAPPDDGFLAVLDEVFARSAAHVVPFDNPLTGGRSANTVYVAGV